MLVGAGGSEAVGSMVGALVGAGRTVAIGAGKFDELGARVWELVGIGVTDVGEPPLLHAMLIKTCKKPMTKSR